MKQKQTNTMRTTVYLSSRRLRSLPLFVAFLLWGFIAFGQQPAANLDQVRNGPSTAPLSPAAWVNGNVNSSQAHFIEGYSIPYRVVMTNLTVGVPIQLQIEYDTKHSGGHAIDFMTYFDNLEPHSVWGHPAEVIDPLLGLSGVPNTPVYATI